MSSMKYPYRDLGVPFDRNFRNDLNANFDDIEHDIRMIGGEAAQQALEAAEEANTQAIYAQTSGDYANDKGDYAAQQGDYAKTQGDYAKAQGDAASLAATNANDAANNANSAAANADNAAATANNAADNANTAADNANDAATNANTAADNANTQATNAQNAAQSANDAATNANNAADNANTQAAYAQIQGDYAKEQGDYAKQVADENKTRWLTAVNTYADIATTYPNPQLGDTVQTIDDSKIYRWDGTQWVWTQQYNANAITDVQNKIGILSKSVIPIKTTSIANNFRPTDLNFRRKSSIRNYYNLKQVVASLDLSSNILLTDSNMYPTQNITTNGLTINQIDLDSRIGKRTIVNLSSNKSIPNATDTIITFDVASINEINAFNISAPTRLTVSERIKKVIIKANVRLQANADGYRSLFIKKNGSKMVGLPAMTTSATPGGVTFVHISSGIIDVVEGDYFEIFVWQNSGVSLNLEANNETWASIEVIE